MTLSQEIAGAFVRLLSAYYQPDGTALELGEILPAEHCADFSNWIAYEVGSALGVDVEVQLSDSDESITLTVGETSAHFSYELGTRLDCDGDGES